MLAYLVDIARADSEDKVARLRRFAQIVLDLLKGFEKLCAVYLLRKVCRGDTENILLTSGKYLRKVYYIRAAELTHEVVKQCHRARIGVRLENDDGALIAQGLHRVEQSFELARMVGIVVINVRTVEFSLEFKSSARPGKTGKTVFYSGGLYAEAYAGCRRGERVFEVMHTGNMDADRIEQLSLVHYIKLRQ